jgi:ABC-type branched-subunit amino acid transport system substrate-binding protein
VRYQAALKSVDPTADQGFVTFEGYLAGRLAIAALEKIDGEPTRKAMLEAIYGGEFDFQGIKLAFTPGHNQGTNDVFVTEIQSDGSFKVLKSLREIIN